MTISAKQLNALLEMLVLTKDEESTCGDCLKQMAEFAESTLAGKSIPDGLKSIDEHLKLCSECREEFEALRDSLSEEMQ